MIIKQNCFEANCIFGWLNVNLGMTLTGYTYMAWHQMKGRICWAAAITKGNHEVYVDHFANTPKWIGRDLIYEFMTFCFNLAPRITAQVGSKNKHAIDFLLRLGFKQEGCVRKSFDGINDTLIFGLLYEEYKQSKFYKED